MVGLDAWNGDQVPFRNEGSTEIESSMLGKLPNNRAGFFHVHSGQYECGIAYREGLYGGVWQPCTKLVNHEGRCGYEDNTAV